MSRHRLDIFVSRDDNTILRCAEATTSDRLILDIEDEIFFMNEEQALQLAERLQRWARRKDSSGPEDLCLVRSESGDWFAVPEDKVELFKQLEQEDNPIIPDWAIEVNPERIRFSPEGFKITK